MKIRRSYRFQLKTNARQRVQLSHFAGCNRFVYNMALSKQKKRLDQSESVQSYAQMCVQLIALKQEYPFLAEVHSQPLQQTLKDLDRALKEGLSQAKGFPRFKKRGKQDSFRYPQGVKIADDKIYLPKIGWLKFRKSREIEGTVKNVMVSRSFDKWYISVQVEMDVEEPKHPSTSMVGVDLGVVKFATVSDGTVYQPINSYRKKQEQLAHQQRKLSRKIKFSANWKEQKVKVQKTHAKIANVRNDYLHKVSSELSKNHAVIVLENLKVKNMTKSAKGTAQEPGRNVAAKSGLNKSILDQGWYEFKRQLQYKQEWAGGRLILVDPRRTSMSCSACGHASAENRQSQEKFHCVSCGHEQNADLNAAKNILAAGRAVLACGDIRQDAA
jgi:putative transposase